MYFFSELTSSATIYIFSQGFDVLEKIMAKMKILWAKL